MSDDKPEPHDLEAERAVLGAVMVTPDTFAEVDWLEAELFYRQAHQHIWRAIGAVLRSGQPLDSLTLRVALDAAGHLEAVGGRIYLAGLIDGVPRSTNAAHYAERVRMLADRRTLMARARTLLDRAALDDDETAILADLEALQAAIVKPQAHRDALDFAAQIDALAAAVERADTGPRLGLGLPAIDGLLDGVQPGEVLGVMARPGIGKTLVLCHVACALSGLGHVCFSLEMPAPQIVERLCRMVYGLDKHRLRLVLRRHELDAEPYLKSFRNLLLDATPGLSVAQMLTRTRQAQRQRPIVAVSVDHLGLIGGDRRATTYDRVSNQARELKELAKRCDVVVILLIQANRDAGGDGSKELHLGSARDSGVIEEACDYMVALRRLDRSTTLQPSERDRYRDVIFAKLLKHRHGVLGPDEIAYRIDGVSLQLKEDPYLKAEENDLRRLATVGGRR